ncbi:MULTISPECIES: metallophosphoesterase [unclassified Rhizobium]|uniref:metallophosphoesterase n=1 Tax=unclassified Rhizobium TaxID=2613769 RepID=UPI000BC987F2|nr:MULTISPECIES: metallophosphoesterase [unclassified Rhizobium]MDH7808716.1 Icc protein [Rhizobium sp. AN67]SOD50843.1 Calcineurin-like phosphoesterase [Rhizobium sp. AN6A]
MTLHPTFVHLTDLHIGAPELFDDHLLSDTSSTLAAILEDIKSIVPQPDFIVISGDLVNRGEIIDYEELQRIFHNAGLTMPVLFGLGNHDVRSNFYQTVLGRTSELAAPYDHDQVVSGIHVIVLDTSVPGRIGGNFEPGQLEWLTAALDRHPELPKLIAMHHGPALDEDDLVGQWETLSCVDTIALRSVLENRNVIGIVSGHVHFDRVSDWYGIPLIVGIGQHAATDVLQLHENLRMVSGSGFALCKLRPSGLTISFVPQPADRRELHVLPLATIAEIDMQRAAALAAAE